MTRRFEEFVSLLNEMPLPQRIEKPLNKIDVKAYREQLKKLGEKMGTGSSRVVIRVLIDSEESVLKIALNDSGLKQNQIEKEIILKYHHLFSSSHDPLLPLLDDYNHYYGVSGIPFWLQFPKVIPFKKTQYKELNEFFLSLYGDFTKLSFAKTFLEKVRPDSPGKKEFGYEFCFLKEFRKLLKKKPESFSEEQWNNISTLYLFIDQSKISIHDLRNPENWGLYQGQLKLIDLGFSDDFYNLKTPMKVQLNNGIFNFK